MQNFSLKTPSPAELQPGRCVAIKRLAWISLAVNFLLSAMKFLAGIMGHSQVIVADAIHSLSDSATDIALLVGVRFWSRPPDADHPHGHQRIETMVAVSIAAVLAAVGVGLTYRALATLQEHHADRPGWIAFIAAAVSIVSKEWLYRWSAGVGRRIRSSAVIANAWHHRSDALSSVPAAAAVATAAAAPGLAFLDHVGAVLVSLFILHAAWRIGWPGLKQLADTGASARQREQICNLALQTDGVRQVHAIRTRFIGPGMQADLHILVDPEITVRQGHEIAGAVKHRLLQAGPNLMDVVVHTEPYEPAQQHRQ
ncbi:MAG: cation diffusion facilitator family transporter [Planctomycetota bacterium]|nr:cation diffusion facilitator family transporter [Planctomycetota bacterium]